MFDCSSFEKKAAGKTCTKPILDLLAKSPMDFVPEQSYIPSLLVEGPGMMTCSFESTFTHSFIFTDRGRSHNPVFTSKYMLFLSGFLNTSVQWRSYL